MSSSSMESQPGRMCGCESRMVSYYCMNHRNKEKFFWKCLNWHGDDTCDIFIWDEGLVEAEDVNGVENIDGNKLKDLEVVELLREFSID